MQDAFWLVFSVGIVEADGKNPTSLVFPFILCVGVQQSPGMATVCSGHSMSITAVTATK